MYPRYYPTNSDSPAVKKFPRGSFQHSEFLASKIRRGNNNPGIGYLGTFNLDDLFYFVLFCDTVKISDFQRALGF